VPFFFKQWGEWLPLNQNGNDDCRPQGDESLRVHVWPGSKFPGTNNDLVCVGKHRAGTMLDGREWKEFPDSRKDSVK
jgi:hypothetical protein